MRPLKPTVLFFSGCCALLGLRAATLPRPAQADWGLPGLAERTNSWNGPGSEIDSARVASTVWHRGFFCFDRTLGRAQSRAVLRVLLDSANYGWGETTPALDHLLVYYDAAGHELGYTRLETFAEATVVVETYPSTVRQRKYGLLSLDGTQRLQGALR